MLHVIVLALLATPFGLSYCYRDFYATMPLQCVVEGFVFAYIMNFYLVALTCYARQDKTELVMCMWGMVYALGFSFSNGIAAFEIPELFVFNMPSLMLFACLLIFNRKIMQSVKINNSSADNIRRIRVVILGGVGLVAVIFFIFTFVYKNFLFSYSQANSKSNYLDWMMLVNGADIILSNFLVSSERINTTLYLALLIVVLCLQNIFSSPSGQAVSAGIILILDLVEGVVFGFFVRHFASVKFDLVKAGNLVSGSLGAMLGPLLLLRYGTASLSVITLFLASVICLLVLNESSHRISQLSTEEEHV